MSVVPFLAHYLISVHAFIHFLIYFVSVSDVFLLMKSANIVVCVFFLFFFCFDLYVFTGKSGIQAYSYTSAHDEQCAHTARKALN